MSEAVTPLEMILSKRPCHTHPNLKLQLCSPSPPPGAEISGQFDKQKMWCLPGQDNGSEALGQLPPLSGFG